MEYSVQFSHSVMTTWTTWTTARQASLSITNSWSWLKLMSIESVMLSNHLILRHPLLLLPSIFPSIRVFSNESALCIKWPKFWSLTSLKMGEELGVRDRRAVLAFCPECHWRLLFKFTDRILLAFCIWGSQIQPISGQKTFGEKIPKSVKKQNLNSLLATIYITYTLYLWLFT